MGSAAAAFLLPTVPAQAEPVGPYAKHCEAGKSAVLARVSGFKAATGSLDVKLYRGNSTFLEKGAFIRRVEVPVNRTGPIEVCLPVPASGSYAISVRHEVRGKKSRADGGGFSGNPKLSLFDVVMKRKPNLAAVSVKVNGSPRVVPITLLYLQGTSLRPVG